MNVKTFEKIVFIIMIAILLFALAAGVFVVNSIIPGHECAECGEILLRTAHFCSNCGSEVNL